MSRTAPPLEEFNNKDLRLLDVAIRQDNPFGQETAALHFLLRLLEAWQDLQVPPDTLDPDQIIVTCRDWARLRDPATATNGGFLAVSIVTAGMDDSRCDPRYGRPSYCRDDQQWRIAIGRVFRAAITGRRDYTLGVGVDPCVTLTYRGLRSSWYKRQFGLFNRPDALGGADAAMSPWLGELLMALLYWPGMRKCQRTITDWSRVSTIRRLKQLVEGRLLALAKLYGRASDLPIYEIPVRLRLKNAPQMTVVTVQTVLPRLEDYQSHSDDVTLGEHAFRVRHRRHLAAVVSLTDQMLRARSTFGMSPQADLIVFPELSVHRDDVYLLERLVDVTQAIVFCGLVFHAREPGGPLVNRGLWLIPDHGPMGRTILRRFQGKQHMTRVEKPLGIASHRPCQLILRVKHSEDGPTWRLTGAICYDATDLRLAADLRSKTDAFVVPALNKHVRLFDNMVAALHYHMYQHFILVNTGEFGGSTVQAPYREDHERTITHSHGGQQIAFAIFEMDLRKFRRPGCETDSGVIYPPAGF